MAYKKSYSPFSFARGAIFASITLIVLFARLSQVTAGKASADTEISFVSSESDWSKDLDNVKSFGPSANAANLDPIIGYEAYRTLRFKIIRKLISVGPNLWNTMCYYASKATQPLTLDTYDGYGPATGSSALSMAQDEAENAKLCDQRALNVLHEMLLPGPWLQMLLCLLLPEISSAVTHTGYIAIKFLYDLDMIYFVNTRSSMLVAQSDWLSARWLRHMDLAQAYMQWSYCLLLRLLVLPANIG